MYNILGICLIAWTVLGPKENITPPTSFELSYNLTQPNASFYMPKDLNEISGLTIDYSTGHLLAIQDEDGLIFRIDKGNGNLIEKYEFWEEGDYEGVEMIGKEVFVIKSSGTVYRVSQLGTGQQVTEKYNDFLKKENDVEGLGYDTKTGQLLLACKKKAGEGDRFYNAKAIYAFDPRTNKLESEPRYLIEWKAVLEYLAEHPEIRKYDKVCEFFDQKKDDFDLSPSALAIHPKSGLLYLLSSVGKLLVVFAPNGKIMHIEKLKKSLFAQPEGICFDRDGTLYIASEKKEEAAVIHRFNVQSANY